MSARDEYIENLKKQLDAWNADLGRFEAKLSELAKPLKVQLEPQLAKARASYEAARQKLGEVRAASGESWQEMTGEVEHVWKTLRQSINYFKSQL